MTNYIMYVCLSVCMYVRGGSELVRPSHCDLQDQLFSPLLVHPSLNPTPPMKRRILIMGGGDMIVACFHEVMTHATKSSVSYR
jgi:predicted amidohydrolase